MVLTLLLGKRKDLARIVPTPKGVLTLRIHSHTHSFSLISFLSNVLLLNLGISMPLTAFQKDCTLYYIYLTAAATGFFAD